MQKKIELFLKFLVGLTFFVPLIFLPKHFIFPFIVPKVITFRIIISIMLGAYAVLLAMDWKRYRIRFSWLNICVALFLLSFGISTFIGVDWYRSLWDNHERMLGFFTVTHYVVYYFIITSVVRGWDDWKWLLRAFLFAGSIVMGIAFIQQMDHKFLLNTSGNRSAATLGNAIYVGGYGIFLTFIGWLLVVKEKNIVWKWFAGIAGILGFLGIFFSGTRGALLGVGVGIVALLFFYSATLKESKKLRSFLAAGFIGCLVVLGILYQYRNNNTVKNLPLIGRILGTSLTGFSETTRGMAWSIAVEGWKDYPVLGWGPGNYYYAFNKYYRPEFLNYGYSETWFDNAHNIVLNTLTERGVVGVSIYLALFGLAVYELLRARKKNSLDFHIVGISAAFLIAHLTQTVSVFENPTSYLYFFFFLAFINSQVKSAQIPNDETVAPVLNKPLPVGILVISSLVVVVFVYSTNINTARANMATMTALKTVYALEDPRDAYASATNIPTPHIDDIRNDFVRTASSALRKYVQANKSDLAIDLFKLCYDEMNKNLQLHPLDLRISSQQALLVQEAASLSGNKKLLVDAERIMEEALKLSPKRQQIIYTLAGIKIQLDKKDEAEVLYKRALADNEKIGESWWRLALMYSVFDRLPEARSIIEEAQRKGVNFNAEGRTVIDNILQKSMPTEIVSSTEK